MITRRFLFQRLGAIALLVLVLSLVACEIPTGTPAICNWGDLMPAYEMVSPGDWTTIDDLTPTLAWRVRGEASCLPPQYMIQIQSAMLYPVGASAGYVVFIGTSTTQSLEWLDDAPALLPGHSYYVYIRNMVYRDGALVQGGDTGFGYFNTGPRCSVSDRLGAPRLRWPPNGWTVDPTSTITLEWDSTMTCWPDNDWTVQISRTESFVHPFEFTDYPMEGVWIHNFFAEDVGITNCSRVYWRARPNMAGVEDEPFSETWSFYAKTPGVICPLDHGPWITPIPYVPLPPDEIPESPLPMAAVIEAAVCWSGPSMEYVILDYLTPGQQLPIQGRDLGNAWWYVDDPVLNKACWVYGEHVQTSGDLNQVPIQQAPPVPTRTPTTPPLNCGQYSNPNACGNNSACWWDPNDPPNSNGSCKHK
jgi:hypothetical protein